MNRAQGRDLVSAGEAKAGQPPGVANASSLAHARNLGPKSAAVLARIGILTLAQLRELGAVRAFALARAAERSISLNLLWAMEGALLDLPWQTVARDARTSLLLALDDVERCERGVETRSPAQSTAK